MACTNPKRCWQQGQTEAGKPKYVFKKPVQHWNYKEQMVPCGKCISCKLQKSAEWATRATHEAQMHIFNCFITLTYAPENLPENESLEPLHLKNFIKKLRRRFKNFKYLACGEYGHNPRDNRIERPHYHLCLFGIDFQDKKYFFTNNIGQPVYRSELLEKLWDKGHSTVCEFTYETAAYTARYTLKKQTENEKYEHVNVDLKTGEVLEPEKYERIMQRLGKQPELIRMSKGLGKSWYEKYSSDTEKDYIIVRGKKHKTPRYYDKLLEEKDPEKLKKVKERREEIAKENPENRKVRRKAKAIIARQSLDKLPRGLDNGN
jgi:hypothetical protein